MADRDLVTGKFVAGNKASPGRPKRVTESEYLDVLIGEVTLDIWRGIVRRALKDALLGSDKARAWVGDYVIGKPPMVIDLRAADAALLAKLLKQFEAVGMSAGDVFAAMLAQVAEGGSVELIGDGDDGDER